MAQQTLKKVFDGGVLFLRAINNFLIRNYSYCSDYLGKSNYSKSKLKSMELPGSYASEF